MDFFLFKDWLLESFLNEERFNIDALHERLNLIRFSSDFLLRQSCFLNTVLSLQKNSELSCNNMFASLKEHFLNVYFERELDDLLICERSNFQKTFDLREIVRHDTIKYNVLSQNLNFSKRFIEELENRKKKCKCYFCNFYTTTS